MVNYKLLEAGRDKSFILPYLCIAFKRTNSVLSKCFNTWIIWKISSYVRFDCFDF